MDILGGMSSGGESPFLKFITGDQQFFVGDEPLQFQYLQLDPATFLSGWGIYYMATGYDFVWDKKFGVPEDRPVSTDPKKEYKRAFSAWVLPQGSSRPLLWQNMSYAETQAFEKDANADLLPVVKYVGSKKIQVGMGQSSELNFEFAKFAPRSNEFVIPSWYYEDDTSDVKGNDGLSDLVDKQVNDSNDLLEDDIPF